MRLFGSNWLTGLIVLWSGALVDIPNGWVLCDGNNGTPDLRNRFIVCAGDTYAVNDTGGNLTHDHEGTADETYDHVAGLSSNEAPCLEEGSTIEDVDPDGDYYYCTEEHAHYFSEDTSGHDHNLTIDVANHLVPYYALAFIMKT